MLKLYYAPRTIALASHIALEEAGAEYEAVRLNFADNDQRKADYLAINPKSRVPSLVTDKGVLTETPAILVYIAQAFPNARLAPLEDAFEFARLQSANSYFCSTVHVAHAHRVRGSRWAGDPQAIDDMKRNVPRTIGECFTLIENNLLEGPWVMGESYTIADPYLFTLSSWMEGDGVDIQRFPKVSDHHARMSKRPAVVKALAEQLAAQPA